MKKIKFLILFAGLLLVSAFTIPKPVVWKIKPNYSVKVVGAFDDKMYFKTLTTMIVFDEEAPEKSKLMATIDAKSLNSPSAEMTEHAKQALEVNKFTEISFVSTSIIKTKLGYEATGDLTIKGITKQIKFPFVFDSKKDLSDKFPLVAKETFNGKMMIAAKDFNITRSGTPTQLFIDITIPVTK